MTYKLSTKTDGKVPDWIYINADMHQIEMDVSEDEEDVYGKTFSFKLSGSFTNLFEETQSFKVIFAEKPVEVAEEEEKSDDGSVNTTETEESDVDDTTPIEESLSLDEVNGWDGWKILLANLGLDFELPKPRTDDPNYIPTPPTISISPVSIMGEVVVKFSEPVFRLDDLTRTIGRRVLAPELFLDV